MITGRQWKTYWIENWNGTGSYLAQLAKKKRRREVEAGHYTETDPPEWDGKDYKIK